MEVLLDELVTDQYQLSYPLLETGASENTINRNGLSSNFYPFPPVPFPTFSASFENNQMGKDPTKFLSSVKFKGRSLKKKKKKKRDSVNLAGRNEPVQSDLWQVGNQFYDI